MFIQKLASSLSLLALVGILNVTPSLASIAYGDNYRSNDYIAAADNRPTYFQRHPYVKKAAIGAGIGAGAGLIFGHGASGVVKGAGIGAGAGLGYEYLRRKGTFK